MNNKERSECVVKSRQKNGNKKEMKRLFCLLQQSTTKGDIFSFVS